MRLINAREEKFVNEGEDSPRTADDPGEEIAPSGSRERVSPEIEL